MEEMVFKRYRHEGCLSYLIGDKVAKKCIVIDPSKDVEQYVGAVGDEGMELLYIIDTHSHADHATGAGRLAKKTGAKVLMNEDVDKQRKASEGKGDEIGIGDILSENASVKVDRKVRDRETIDVGNLSFKFIKTPGHTMDAMCILADYRILTGDTLMIGLCGRTDLPGGSTNYMYESIFTKLAPLRDDLLVYPSHDYRGNVNSSMGYEKVNNPFFFPRKLEEFTAFVKKTFPPPKGSGMQCGIMKSDVSDKDEETAGPLMNRMCIAIERLLQEYPDEWDKWNVIDVKDVKKKLDTKEDVFLLDVREPEEYAEGHIDDAMNIPVKELPQSLDRLPKNMDAKILTYCASGFRSAHAAIFLKAYGYANVKNIEHGIHEWEEEGFKVNN